MNGVNENSVDIFILCAGETAVPPFAGHLEKKGYRVTLFTDGACLLETLRTGKPDLLICDTTTSGKEAFEVCYRTKADDDLRAIPVLILTSASTLSDLLLVLDCNADNFIPLPCDLPTCSSVIESMLKTPVEQQRDDPVTTRFRISHDDRIYSVAANRRKLLELLLTSFEIAAGKSSELSQVRTELQALSESARSLEDRVTDQARLIDTMKATLDQKEQKISALTSEVGEKNKIVAQKTRKAVIVEDDEVSRALFKGNAGPGENSGLGINTLLHRISELSYEVDAAKVALETARDELEDEKIHCTSLECTLELLGQQKEFAERSLRSMTDEHQKMISSIEDERKRVLSEGQDPEAVMPPKTQSEQDLKDLMDRSSEAKRQYDADLSRLKDDLGREVDRRISAEGHLALLRQDKDSSLELLCRQKESAEKSLREITERHEQMISAFEAERDRVISAEMELKGTIQAKTQSEQDLKDLMDRSSEAKRQYDADLSRLKDDLGREVDRRISAEGHLTALREDNEHSESLLTASASALEGQLDDLRVQLETARATLEDKEMTTQVLNENLAKTAAENEKIRMKAGEDLELERATLKKQKCDLDEATALVKALERNLNAVKIQNKALVDELNLANKRRPQPDQQVRLLTDELKKARAALDTERSQRQSVGIAPGAATPAAGPVEPDSCTLLEARSTETELPGNQQKAQGEDLLKTIGGQEHPGPEFCEAAVQQTCVQDKTSSGEETPGLKEDDVRDSVLKDTERPLATGPLSRPTAMQIIPDSQKSPILADNQIQSKPFLHITEVSSGAVTDIIDVFGEDDFSEEDNLS